MRLHANGCLAGFGIRRTVDGQPLVLVLALRQLHHLAQAPSAQCCLGILAKLVARSATLARYSGSELVLRPVVAVVVRWLALFLACCICLGRGWVLIPGGWWAPDNQTWGRKGTRGGTIGGGPSCRRSRQQKSTQLTRSSERSSWRGPGAWALKRMFLNCSARNKAMLAGQSLMTQLVGARSTTAAQAESGFRVRGCAPMQAEAEAGGYRVDAVTGLDGCKVLVVEDDAGVGEKGEGRKSTMHQCGGTGAECLHPSGHPCDWQQPPD